MNKKIYKVFTEEEWLSFQTENLFMGSAADKKDGFIHFSTSDQLDRTIKKHFPNQDNVIIAEFSAQPFGEALKW